MFYQVYTSASDVLLVSWQLASLKCIPRNCCKCTYLNVISRNILLNSFGSRRLLDYSDKFDGSWVV